MRRSASRGPNLARRSSIVSILALAGLLAGAGAAEAKSQSVDIRFAGYAGDKAIKCGSTLSGLGSTNQTAKLQDFRFYVSNVRMIGLGGTSVPVKLSRSRFQTNRGRNRVALIDLENATRECAEEGTGSVNRSVRGSVPRGRYKSMSFTVGVPYALNHTDLPGAPRPLNILAMGWSWQFGRKHAKIELTNPAWSAKTFFVHLGSTGCEGDPAAGERVKCSATNRAAIRFRRFNPRRQAVALDVRKLVRGTDVTQNKADAPGCMSSPGDPECTSVFSALGIGYNAGRKTGKSPVGRQSAFRAVSR